MKQCEDQNSGNHGTEVATIYHPLGVCMQEIPIDQIQGEPSTANEGGQNTDDGNPETEAPLNSTDEEFCKQYARARESTENRNAQVEGHVLGIARPSLSTGRDVEGCPKCGSQMISCGCRNKDESNGGNPNAATILNIPTPELSEQYARAREDQNLNLSKPVIQGAKESTGEATGDVDCEPGVSGRQKSGDDQEIVALHNSGIPFRSIGKALGISHVAARKRYLRATKVNIKTVECGSLPKLEIFVDTQAKKDDERVTLSNIQSVLSQGASEDSRTKSELVNTGNFQKEKSATQKSGVNHNETRPCGNCTKPDRSEMMKKDGTQESTIVFDSHQKEKPASLVQDVNPQKTKYLKKHDTPDHNYFVWTEALSRRDDLFPYDPVTKRFTSMLHLNGIEE